MNPRNPASTSPTFASRSRSSRRSPPTCSGSPTELGLPHPDRILSLADLANRMISLRLEPEQHPVAADGRGSLLLDSWRAAARRSNVSPAMKPLFVAWFAAMAALPRPLARRLALLFLFPERRGSLNRLLGRFQSGR